MQNRLKSLAKRLLSLLTTTAMMATMMVALIPMPTASAAGAENTFTAKFNSTDARKFLTLTFTNPVCGNPSCTANLGASDFTYVPTNGDGFASISSCNHIAGSRIVVCVMDVASSATDTLDSVYAKTGAVWSVDGSIPSGSGEAVLLTSAADTTGPSAVYQIDAGANASDKIIVKYNEPVVTSTGTALVAGNFTYGEVGAGTAASISSVMQTKLRAGADNYAVLTLNGVLATADEADTLQLDTNEVYDIYGNVLADPGVGFVAIGSAVVLADATDGVDENPTTAPAISTAYAKANITTGPVLVEFDYPVTTTGADTGALASLVVTDIQYGAADVEAVVSHTGGDTVAIFADTTTTLTTIAAVGTSIYTPWNVAAATTAVAVDDVTNPVPTDAWINMYIDGANEDESGTDGGGDTYGAIADGEMTVSTGASPDSVIITPQQDWGMYQLLSTADYADLDGFMVDLNQDIYDDTNSLYEFTSVVFDMYIVDADATSGYTASSNALAFIVDDAVTDITTDTVEWFLPTNVVEKTWTTQTIDLTSAPGVGTLAALSSNPQFWGLKVTGATTAGELDANDYVFIDNVKFIRGASSKSNNLYLKYAEWVELTGDPAEGAGAVGSVAASSTAVGDMTTSKRIAGLGDFTTGTLTTKTLTNSVAKDTATSSNGNVYNVTLANRSGGLINIASPVTLSSTFTPIAGITDKDANTVATGATVVANAGSALDLTTAATAPTDFRPTLVKGGEVRHGWTAPSQTAATFSHYAVMYGSAAGITVASTLWDEATAGQSALATATTAETTVTGLTDGTVYYFNLAAVDAKGIPTTLLTEMSALPSAATGSKAETIAPAIPTNLKATVNAAGKVVLTWTDPTDTDLNVVQLAKGTGKDAVPASILGQVGAGVKTFTDTAVSLGDIVNYKINAIDKNGNASAYSAVVSITVKVGETAVTPAVETKTETKTETDVDTDTDEEDDEEEDADDDEDEDMDDEEEDAPVVLKDSKEIEKNYSWAQEAITTLVDEGVIKGHADGNFKPGDKLNRGDAALLFCRVLGLDEEEKVTVAPFTDVKADSSIAGCLAQLKEEGVAKGTNGYYYPANSINRAEFFTLAIRAYVSTLDEDEKADLDTAMNAKEPKASFSDVKAEWYANVASVSKDKGFVEGKSCGKGKCFDAQSNITRAEAVTVLFRIFFK